MSTSQEPHDRQTIRLKDGRILGVAEYGSLQGTPVLAFHGMPGSRLMFKVTEQAALSCGVRLIATERPGYGLSQPWPRGTLFGYVDSIAKLADALGLQRFAVMGVSGGGPYALACACWLPHRLSAAAVVSGIGWLRAPGSMRRMAAPNRIMFNLGRLSPSLAGFWIARLLRSSMPSLEKHVQAGTSPTPDLSPTDFAIMAADQKEAVRSGWEGVSFDMNVLWREWGFRLEEIRMPVSLWHGESDDLAPAALAHATAEAIPGCQATFYPGEGHTGPLTGHMEEILGRIVSAVGNPDGPKP